MISKEKLLEIWKDALQENEVDLDKTLFDQGMDSIKVIDISEAIFKLTGIRLEWENFNITSSFNETYELLSSKFASA
ncbi:acyl carrier protein [Serratia rhizosphaerae]|uniref:acyl carrier protein n=1 Tax=Serratia sp. Tan611 TaxID=2773264 RepID=UPI001932EA4B|nr:acyl carrier protein [Serratia sp. Tan611]CAE1147821.1 Phosphopantetheine-binding protein [Serratia sp. Tan611]